MPSSKPTEQPCPDHPEHTELWRWTWGDDETEEDAEQECVRGCPHPDHDDPGEVARTPEPGEGT